MQSHNVLSFQNRTKQIVPKEVSSIELIFQDIERKYIHARQFPMQSYDES